jgi:hypothetical protein
VSAERSTADAAAIMAGAKFQQMMQFLLEDQAMVSIAS